MVWLRFYWVMLFLGYGFLRLWVLLFLFWMNRRLSLLLWNLVRFDIRFWNLKTMLSYYPSFIFINILMYLFSHFLHDLLIRRSISRRSSWALWYWFLLFMMNYLRWLRNFFWLVNYKFIVFLLNKICIGVLLFCLLHWIRDFTENDFSWLCLFSLPLKFCLQFSKEVSTTSRSLRFRFWFGSFSWSRRFFFDAFLSIFLLLGKKSCKASDCSWWGRWATNLHAWGRWNATSRGWGYPSRRGRDRSTSRWWWNMTGWWRRSRILWRGLETWHFETRRWWG